MTVATNVKVHNFNRKFLLTTSIAAMAMGISIGAAQGANEWSSTFWGGPFPFVVDPLISDLLPGDDISVIVDSAHAGSITTNNGLFVGNDTSFEVKGTGSVNSAIWGIWGQFASSFDATIDGSVTAAGNGVTLNTVAALGTGDITITGAGKVDAGGYGLWLLADKGTIDVTGLNGGIAGDLNGIYAISTSGEQNYSIAGPITSTAGYGILTSSVTGNISADGQGTGSIDAFIDGVYLNTLSATDGLGDITVQNFTGGIKGGNNGVTVNFGTGGTLGDVLVSNNGDISGTIRNGIETYSFGDTTITDNGNVKGAINGIAANFAWASPGDVKISGNGNITGGGTGSGIVAGSGTGDIDISADKITKGGTGIWAVSSLGGDVKADGGGTGDLTGTTVDGALVQTLGNATVDKFATVKGLRNGIYVSGTGAGTATSVQGNGLVGAIEGTTGNGIVVGPTRGDVNIGDVATNGIITGGINGIWVNGSTGDTNIVTDKNVSGSMSGGWGILTTTTSGDNTVHVKAGTVKGNAALEVSTVGAGNVDTTIDADAIINGTTWGYVTTTAGGTGVTDNSGTIRTVADNGLSGDTGLVATVWVKGGTGNIINNNSGGEIFGGFTDAGLNTVFNNKTGAVWDAALANAMNATSTINNTGIINIRQGATVGVGVTNNQSGGLIDLTYGGTSPLATDYLYTYGYNALGGSNTNFNVDYTLANGSGVEALADDHSSDGLGTADTIGSIANPSPTAGAIINLVNVGGPKIATSGSIALILPSANAAGMVDPGLGGLGSLVQSSNYVYGAGDQNSGAVKVVLQEDAFGGLYLRWAPNITASSMAGFTGGAVLGDEATSGASASGATAGLAGMGAGLGSGGVAGSIADAAGASAGNNDGCSVGKDGQDDTYSNASRAWISGTGSSSSFDGGSTGWDIGTAIGIEHDLGSQAGIGCGDLAIGLFAAYGQYGSDSASGSTDGAAKGGGVYLKAATKEGFYATGVVGASWSEADMTNSVFGSTATQGSFGYMGSVALGYSAAVSDSFGIDGRVFGTIAHSEGDGFTDSVGIVVDGSSADVRTVGFLLGANADLGSSTTAFVRGGAKWMTVDQEISAFGITVAGTAEVFVKTIEAGIESEIGNGATFSAKAFGDFTDNSDSYGGTLTVAFEL
jgi:hypothetical protein